MLILSLTLLDFTGWPFVAACRVCRGTGMSRRAPSASAAVEDQQDSGHSKTCVFPAANMAIIPVQAYQNQRRIAMRRGWQSNPEQRGCITNEYLTADAAVCSGKAVSMFMKSCASNAFGSSRFLRSSL